MARSADRQEEARQRRREQARRRYDALETARKQRRENTKWMLRGLPLPMPLPSTAGKADGPHRRAPVPRPSKKLVSVFAVITVIVLGTPFLLRAPAAPRLATSCTGPALAVSSSSAPANSVVRFSVTGPATASYALAIDATRLDPPPSGAGMPVAVGGRLLATASGLRGCKGAGRFRVAVPPGEHRLVLFRDTALAASLPLTVR